MRIQGGVDTEGQKLIVVSHIQGIFDLYFLAAYLQVNPPPDALGVSPKAKLITLSTLGMDSPPRDACREALDG